MMDTYTQAITLKRRYRALEEKRRIVEETLVEGASVALVARAHGVNANLVFNWRRQYQAGRLGRRGEAKLLPVKMTFSRTTCEGTGGRVRLSGITLHLKQLVSRQNFEVEARN